MKEEQVSKLKEISDKTWKAVLAKCYCHVQLQLKGKTDAGAHCEQRLGIKAVDHYVEKAYEALFLGTWEWKYDQYSIEEQLIRIIDSMISEQVRKYKVEKRRGKKTTLVSNEQLVLAIESQYEDNDYDESYLKQLNEALTKACDLEKYKQFIELKREGYSYSDISKKMNCCKEEVYQMRETISRRAIKNLKS